MIILIILIVILLIGLYLMSKSITNVTGFLISIFSGAYIIIHVICWITAPYDYNSFVAQREAFVETLEHSRKSGNVYESATIMTEISQWNQELAKCKYQNTLFFLDDYIDDRIDDLTFIK